MKTLRRYALLAGVITALAWSTACGGSGTTPARVISPPLQFRITTITLPTAKLGVSYSQPIVSTNGVAPITWTTTAAGARFSDFGLSLDPSTGQVSGTPTLLGSINVEVEGTDSSSPPRTARQFVQLQIVPRLSFPPLTFVLHRDQSTSNSVSTQGGVPPIIIDRIGGSLPPGMGFGNAEFLGSPTQVGIYIATLRARDSSFGGQDVITTDFTLDVQEKPPRIITLEIAKAIVGRPYDFRFSVEGGTPPFTWSMSFPVSSSVPGLTFDTALGLLSGVPTLAGDYGFDVSLRDSSATPQFANGFYNIRVDAAPRGRNDSIATASRINNGNFRASLSPFVNGAGVEAADTDYYVATANGGVTVTVQVMHDRTRLPESPMDPVLEIVNASGQRLTTCRNQGTDDGVTGAPDTTPNAFNDVCLVDDNFLGFDIDSSLELRIPAGAAQTFYIHVLDFSGDARPDLTYQLSVNGVN